MELSVVRSMSNSRVLVTGATGFVGQHLVRALVDSGRRVRALKRSTSDTSDLKEVDCEWVTADLEDLHLLKDAVRGCNVVYHAAGLASFGQLQCQAVYRVNVQGTPT